MQSSSTLPSNPPSRDETDYFSSRSNSNELESPYEINKEKHIRFDEKVEQCIAVECKESVFDDSEHDVEDDPPNSALSDSSSDEGLFMMNKRQGARRDSSQKGKLSRSNSTTGQMIETLPSTTLKNRTDSPDVTQEAQQHHIFGKNWGTPMLSPSPSQETLRPSRPSRNFLIGGDDGAELDSSSSWSFGSNNPKSSLGASVSSEPHRRGEFSYTDGYDGIEGMRRTESGMFMPYDEDEDDKVAEGLFGRVSETINTFRDIGKPKTSSSKNKIVLTRISRTCHIPQRIQLTPTGWNRSELTPPFYQALMF